MIYQVIRRANICNSAIDTSVKLAVQSPLAVSRPRSLPTLPVHCKRTILDMSCSWPTVEFMSRAVQFDSYGDVDVLEVRDVPRPVPAANEVLVEVRAAGINPSEAVIRSGALADQFPATFPSGQGSDLAGVVAELGSDVTEFAVGDEVIGFSMRRSSHAEYVTVPSNQLTAKPSEVPWEVAGSLFVAGATAYAAVRAVRLHAGDTVAIAGAAGGVGSIAVQLLPRRGAKLPV